MVKHKKPKQISNKKKQKNKDKQKSAPNQKVPSVEELVQAGDAAAASLEGDKALALYESAHQLLKEQSPLIEQQIVVLEKLGEARANMGMEEEAKQDFQNAIKLLTEAPQETNPQFQETLAGLHLYIGQLSAEQQALEAYQKGLRCLEASVELRQQECANTPATISEDDEMDTEEKETTNANHPAVALNETRQKLATARVSVAELYLTDLCFEENAESECEKHVQKALEITDVDGEPMVDALQTAASLRLSQQRPQDARTIILRAYQKMQVGCEALAKLVGLGCDKAKSKRAVELTQVDAADNLPSFEFRCQTAKLLLECGAGKEGATFEQITHCHQAAIHVLGSLLAENDEVTEVWYLLGCAFQACNNVENAKYYWNKALEMLTAIQKQMEEETGAMEGDDDENDELDLQLQNIACQMEEIKSKLEDIEEEEEEDKAAKMEE